MTDQEFSSNHEHHDAPSLREAISKPEYQDYAFSYEVRYSSLIQKQVPVAIQNSEEFRRTVEVVQWPDDSDTKEVVPPYDYADPQEFIDSLFGRKDGRDTTQDRKFLNNFNALLRYEPATIDEQGTVHPNTTGGIESRAASMTPALLRAQCIIPDLLAGLRLELADKRGQAAREVYETNRDVVAGAYMAYRILGRLVKQDDSNIMANLVGYTPSEPLPPERFAHDSLVR